MIDLHPTRCGCADCRNRRLISSWDRPGEGHLPDERELFGSALKGEDVGRGKATAPSEGRGRGRQTAPGLLP
jgi:hypothetical protein